MNYRASEKKSREKKDGKKANIELFDVFEIVEWYLQFARIDCPGHFGNYHDTREWIVVSEISMA